MGIPGSNDGPAAIGQAWLRRQFGLAVPAPAVESYVVQGARRTAVHGSRTLEFYPRQYDTDGTVASHLRFALRHEPIDLGVLVAVLKAMVPAELESWVRAEPTGAYSRRAWFFYETFAGRTLDLEDTRAGNYVEALDPERHVVADRRNSVRHRVIDNLRRPRPLPNRAPDGPAHRTDGRSHRRRGACADRELRSSHPRARSQLPLHQRDAFLVRHRR